MRFSRLLVLLIGFVVTTSPFPLVAAPCINWPVVMAKEPSIVFPFVNQSGAQEDAWLEMGLAGLLTDYLRAAEKIPEGGSVSGSFQHPSDRLRIFITTTRNGELLKQFAIDIPYPDHKDFFEQTADASMDIVKLLGGSSDGRAVAMIRDATSSTRCYEAYAKGRQALAAYTIKGAKEAIEYFEEAKRIDFRSSLGYQGLIDAYTFLGLFFKQEQKPFGSYLQRAGGELTQMSRLTKTSSSLPSIKPSKPKKKGESRAAMENRFLKGHVFFVDGLHAAQTGNLQLAKQSLQESVKLVPEDAFGWYHLSRFDQQLGNLGEAAEERTRAITINPCLER